MRILIVDDDRAAVDALTTTLEPAGYHVDATRSAAYADTHAPLAGGRPLVLTAEALLDVYHQYADCGPRGIVLERTRSEVARQLRVSMDTIERRERELIAAGTIRRAVSKDRQRSFVILSPATWDATAERAVMRSTQELPFAADQAAAGQDTTLETGIPVAPVPTPAQAPGADAEETHHPAAGPEGAANEETQGSSAADRQGVRVTNVAVAWAGVSIPLRVVAVVDPGRSCALRGPGLPRARPWPDRTDARSGMYVTRIPSGAALRSPQHPTACGRGAHSHNDFSLELNHYNVRYSFSARVRT